MIIWMKKYVIESSNLWPKTEPVNKWIYRRHLAFMCVGVCVCAQVINIFRFGLRLGIRSDCDFCWMQLILVLLLLLSMQKVFAKNLNELHVLCIVCRCRVRSSNAPLFRYRLARLECAITYRSLFCTSGAIETIFLCQMFVLSPLFPKNCMASMFRAHSHFPGANTHILIVTVYTLVYMQYTHTHID